MAIFNEGKGKPGQAKARMTACLPTRTRRALALALQRREALLKNDRTAHASQSPLVPFSPPGCAHLIKMQTKYLRRRPRERGQVSSILHGGGGAWTSRRQPSLGAAILNGPACQAMSCRPGAGVRRALYMPCTPSFPYRPGSLSLSPRCLSRSRKTRHARFWINRRCAYRSATLQRSCHESESSYPRES